MPEPELSDLEQDLGCIARAEVLNLMPMPGAPGPSLAEETGRRVRESGERAIPGLERIALEGKGTGRVWAIMILRELAPERGRAHLERLIDDPTPVQVNTCLVGLRTTADFARWSLGLPPVRSEKSRLRQAAIVVGVAVLIFAVLMLCGLVQRWKG